jgi:putative PEP-CTERM system TPR-repeat lipoprotein
MMVACAANATIIGGVAAPGTAFAGPGETDSDAVANELKQREFAKAIDEASKQLNADPTSVSGYNMRGVAQLGTGDVAGARKSFEAALSLEKSYVPAQVNLAHLDVLKKDFAGARTRYEAILKVQKNEVSAMVGMARLEALQGRDGEAIEWLERAKQVDPGALPPRMMLGVYQLRHGNSAVALTELNQARVHHPNDPELLNLLGQAEFISGQKDSAVSTYKRWVGVEPLSALAHYRLAAAQAGINDLPSAEASLRKALAIKPDYIDAVVALVSLLASTKRMDEAMGLALDLKRRRPDSPSGPMLEADIVMLKGQYANAAALYEKALELKPSNVALIKLHMAQSHSGGTKDSMLKDWLKSHPDDTTVQQYLAWTYLQADQPKLAIEQYQLLAQKNPKDVTVVNNLAALYLAAKDPRALETAERAYALLPDSAAVADTLGWALIEQGKMERGLGLLERAAEKEPKNPEIRYHLAAALARSGNRARARREIEALLATQQQFPHRDAAQALLKSL